MGCNVSFIGAGYMTREHIRSFSDVEGANLVGIHSRTLSKANALADEFNLAAGACTSIKELYEKTGAGLVVISVPELSTREVCLEAFKYPWTCLIEKPVGYNLEDAQVIASAARQVNAKVFVGLNRRHHASTRQVLQELSLIDDARLVHVFDQENPVQALAGGQPELVVKNWMYANSIHMVDYLNILGRGRIVSVEPVIAWNPDEPGFVITKITYDSGDAAIYEAVWNAPGPWAVTVTTHSKRWEMRPLEQAFTQLNGSRKQEAIEVGEWDKKFKPGLRFQAGEAVKAALGQAHQLPDLDEAMRSMELISQIYS
jgi:predicted dehydrogenase